MRVALENLRPSLLPDPEAGAAFQAQMVLADSQLLERHEVEEYQLEHLKALVNFAAREVPYWHSRIAPNSIDDAATLTEALARLPILTRTRAHSEREALRAGKLPSGEVLTDIATPPGLLGTTLTVPTTQLNLRWQRVLRLRGYLWAGLDFSRSLANIQPSMPGVAEYPHGLRQVRWGPPSEIPFSTGPYFQLNASANPGQQWEWLSRTAAAYLHTSPSCMRGYVELANEPRTLAFEKILVIGEGVDAELRSFAASRLNAAIHHFYVSQDVGCIALQCSATQMYHVQSEAIVVEVLNDQARPCRPGELGRVVVTPLFDFATPLIRYQIGDLAEVAADCNCGRSLPTLRRVLRNPDDLSRPRFDLLSRSAY